MPDYSIFGGCLRSEITFPELREFDVPPREATWTLTTTPSLPELPGAECLGELMVTPSCGVRLWRHPGGFRVHFDDTGAYDVSADGRHITWWRGPYPRTGAVRADVTGRVIAAAMHAAGTLCLHGSAVSLPGGTVAFLAPKFHGKSTLALSLARAGGRLVTDDVLAVDMGDPPMAVPGVHDVKLWDDSAELLGVEQREVEAGEKHLVHDLPDEMLAFERTPLAAIYLLAPLPTGVTMNVPARRDRLSGVPSALALVRHTAMADLLGGAEAARIFDRAAALSAAVPVYRLDTVPGLDRIGGIVSQLLDWHAAGAPVAAAAANS